MAKKKITFHHIKTAGYRTYHADGFFGGLTPGGKLYMEMYLDRSPTPKAIDFEISADGKSLGKEISRDSKEGVIREIEAGVIFDLHTAESLITWLQNKVAEFKSLQKQVNNGKSKN